MSDIGSLFILVTEGGGGYPIEGARVRITGADEDDRGYDTTYLTDRSGTVGPIYLPAPAVAFSQVPDPKQNAYASYDVSVTADGFYRKDVNGVAIFSGIRANLPINLVPFSRYLPQDNRPDNPQTNLPGNGGVAGGGVS